MTIAFASIILGEHNQNAGRYVVTDRKNSYDLYAEVYGNLAMNTIMKCVYPCLFIQSTIQTAVGVLNYRPVQNSDIDI